MTEKFKSMLMIWLPLVIATFVIAGVILTVFSSSSLLPFKRTDKSLKKTNAIVSATLYKTFKVLDEVFAENDIDYWIVTGTLLGAVRHKGLIPWNDGGDIQFCEKDVNKVLEIEGEFKKRGYQLLGMYGGYRLVPTVRPTRKHFPAIDLCPVKIEGSKIFPAWKEDKYWNYKIRNYFTHDELYPLKSMEFGPLKLSAPNKPIAHIRRYYGDDWNEVAYMIFDHHRWKKVSEVKTLLVNRSPTDYDNEVFLGKIPRTWKAQQ